MSSSSPPPTPVVVTSHATVLLVNTTARMERALWDLASHSALIVDCEGTDLGKNDTSLCLLQIKPFVKNSKQKQPTVYLFDVVALGGPVVFHHPASDAHVPRVTLANLLCSTSILKIVFDGRMDARALFREHNVQLTNVMDAQLLNVATAAKRGRALRFMPGLMATLRYTNKQFADQLDAPKQLVTAQFENDPAAWRTRPLPDHFLEYAANDCIALERVYTHLDAQLRRVVVKSAYNKAVQRLLAESHRRMQSMYGDDVDMSREAMTTIVLFEI